MQAGAAPKEPPRSTRRSSLLKRSEPGVPMPSPCPPRNVQRGGRRSGSQVLYKTYKKTAGRGKVADHVATVRAALSAAITDDVDEADRLDVLEGCYRVLGDARDSMWTA